MANMLNLTTTYN